MHTIFLEFLLPDQNLQRRHPYLRLETSLLVHSAIDKQQAFKVHFAIVNVKRSTYLTG